MADTELDELLKDTDISIRPVHFDKLVQFDEVDLQNREAYLADSVARIAERLATLKKRVVTEEQLHTFLVTEHQKVSTALKVKRDELVRIVCPTCSGTGLRSVDAFSGKIRGTAFEGTGAGGSVIVRNVEIDPENACLACGGKQWQLMPRYKG